MTPKTDTCHPRPLNKTSYDVLAFIRQYINRHGFAPLYREIGDGCYLTQTGAQKVVQRLVREGFLTVDQRKKRSIRLTGKELPS